MLVVEYADLQHSWMGPEVYDLGFPVCVVNQCRQGLMRIVEWADQGTNWSHRGIVEQEVFVQEGDFFVIADDSKLCTE